MALQTVISREDATKQVLAAKKIKGLTFERIASAVGRDKVWTTAALLGQHPMSVEESEKAVKALGFAEGAAQEVAAALQEIPTRGSLDTAVPVDPTIYRFYELIQVYGPTLKALIHEMFGDGILSAIDFEMDIQKKPDPKGDRVVVTLNGKFLSYKKW
jgi:cyanate lyase